MGGNKATLGEKGIPDVSQTVLGVFRFVTGKFLFPIELPDFLPQEKSVNLWLG